MLASRRGNDLLTIFAGNLFVGLSYGWWADKHNRHHAKPNHEGHDPDIGEGVLAFTGAALYIPSLALLVGRRTFVEGVHVVCGLLLPMMLVGP